MPTIARNATAMMRLGRKKRPSLRTAEVQQAADGEIFWLLRNGALRQGMPSWSSLPEPSRWQIIAYIKSLGEYPASREPANMKTHDHEMGNRWHCLFLLMGCVILFSTSCGAGKAPDFPTDVDVTPAEDSIGERLFLDTRFAQYFATHMTGVNQPLAVGDPVVQQVDTTSGALPGPFAGQSINCRSCHFVTEFQGVTGAGNRTYSDFASHSPIPRPMNGFIQTPRNAMHMVGSLQPHAGPIFLHFDGEFAYARGSGEGHPDRTQFWLGSRSIPAGSGASCLDRAPG